VLIKAVLLDWLWVCLPSLFCVNAFGGYWATHRNHPCLKSIFDLLRPTVTGLVFVAALTLIASSLWESDVITVKLLKTVPNMTSLVIAAIAFVLTAFLQVSPIRVLLAGIVAGLLVASV
jgi:chromate transport protein ChrA